MWIYTDVYSILLLIVNILYYKKNDQKETIFLGRKTKFKFKNKNPKIIPSIKILWKSLIFKSKKGIFW